MNIVTRGKKENKIQDLIFYVIMLL